jgi:hypothetical protein
MLGKRVRVTTANDEVIQCANINKAECLLQALCDEFIGLAGFRDARGMVMG